MKLIARTRAAVAATGLVFALASGPSAAGFTIVFDYTYDTTGFFSDLSRRALLDTAASVFTSRISDSLSAISPGGINSWTAQPFNPNDINATLSISNLSVPANTVIIYAGATALSGNTLGVGGPGGYGASGTQGWFNTLQARGNSGALGAENTRTDFAPWGGALTFSTTAAWYFDSDVSTIEPFEQNDFYSVAVHEIGHVLGVGTADSWQNKVSGGNFTGAYSVSLKGGVIPLDAEGGHWAEGTESMLPGTLTTQEAAMDPSILTGTRKYFTELDYAGMADIGWEVSGVSAIPEPSTYALLVGAGALGLGVWRRRPRVSASATTVIEARR